MTGYSVQRNLVFRAAGQLRFQFGTSYISADLSPIFPIRGLYMCAYILSLNINGLVLARRFRLFFNPIRKQHKVLLPLVRTQFLRVGGFSCVYSSVNSSFNRKE